MKIEKEPDLPAMAIEKWLSPKEVAGHFGLNEDSCYRWISEGVLARRFVRFSGTRRMRIHPAALRDLEMIFERAHD